MLFDNGSLGELSNAVVGDTGEPVVAALLLLSISVVCANAVCCVSSLCPQHGNHLRQHKKVTTLLAFLHQWQARIPELETSSRHGNPDILDTITNSIKTLNESMDHVLSWLDYYNSVSIGLPACPLDLASPVGSKRCMLHQGHASLHWLRVPECILFKISVLTYRALNGSTPAYLSSYFTRVVVISSRLRLRSSTSEQLIVLSFNLTMVGNRAFPVSAANLWNNLPTHLISAPSLAIFWQRLKTFLFQRSYPDSIIWYSELPSYCGSALFRPHWKIWWWRWWWRQRPGKKELNRKSRQASTEKYQHSLCRNSSADQHFNPLHVL